MSPHVSQSIDVSTAELTATGLLVPQQVFHGCDRLLLHVRKDVAVNIQGQADATMP